MTDRRWLAAVSALASVLISLPLIVHGTPDVESYTMSIFSTLAFARNLVAGVDPWFVSGFGFGILLPTSTWFIKFPPAIPAALLGVDVLYAAVWLGGEFLFAYYFLKLCTALTRSRAIALVLLATGLLSFSNLGPSYVDDWPEHFLGWAFFPACLWFVLTTLLASSTRERIRATAACGLVLGIFTGCAHQNEIVTFYSGMTLVLAFFLWTRPAGVFAVGLAVVAALVSALDVIAPTLQGMMSGGVNPVVGSVARAEIDWPDTLTLRSYGIFLEPARSFVTDGMASAGRSSYGSVPFFGVTVLVLAALGAIRAFRSRVPAGQVPNDVARSLAVGFVVYSVLTLLPSGAMFNLPRMWMYRDGQTVFGLLCAALALDWLRDRPFRLAWLRDRPISMVWPVLVLHAAQISLVAAPIVFSVLGHGNTERLFAYARRPHVLFDGLRQAGVDHASRVMVAGELDDALTGLLPVAGVTARTDFELEGLSVVNAWYRGAGTPALGAASVNGRYGDYETYIAWESNLRHLQRPAVDVLGITYIIAFERDVDGIDLLRGLPTAGRIALADGQTIRILRNDNAWSRAVLLTSDRVETPSIRPGCPLTAIYCRDFTPLRQRLQHTLAPVWSGSSMRVELPPGHTGGRLFVSVVAGPSATASVDGQPRDVERFMDTFATIATAPGDRVVTLSAQRTDRIALSAFGFLVLAICGAVAIMPGRTA